MMCVLEGANNTVRIFHHMMKRIDKMLLLVE